MTTPDIHNMGPEKPAHPRRLGFWLKVTERAISHEFEAAFANAGITRRDWRVLRALAASGDAREDNIEGNRADRERPGRAARMAERIAERIARKPHSVHTLADLGWITERDGSWVITEKGLAAHVELASSLGVIRARITDAVPAEDLATTIASLEAIAREFGWDESKPGPYRGRREAFDNGGLRPFDRGAGRGAHRPEFGPNLHHGFGPGRGDAPVDGHRGEPRCDTANGGEHRGAHRPAHRRHETERAFERGFDAGFARGTLSAA